MWKENVLMTQVAKFKTGNPYSMWPLFWAMIASTPCWKAHSRAIFIGSMPSKDSSKTQIFWTMYITLRDTPKMWPAATSGFVLCQIPQIQGKASFPRLLAHCKTDNFSFLTTKVQIRYAVSRKLPKVTCSTTWRNINPITFPSFACAPCTRNVFGFCMHHSLHGASLPVPRFASTLRVLCWLTCCRYFPIGKFW